MSHFFATVQGSSPSIADRRGSRHSGITATLGTRRAQVTLRLWHGSDGVDRWQVDRAGPVPSVLASGVVAG